MGGNQAMRDTVDMLPHILHLAQKATEKTLKEEDYSTAVNDYEAKMAPRAFGWVKASGGSGEIVSIGEPTPILAF